MGNSWESADVPRRESIPLIPVYSTQSIPASDAGATGVPSARLMADAAVRPDVSAYGMYPVAGSSGFGDDDLDPPERPGRGPVVDYYPEEQHWTDYLRIGLPVLGALIMIILVFFLLSSVFGGDEDPGTQGAAGTATLSVITSSTPTVGVGGAATGTPSIIVTTPPAGTTPSVPAGAVATATPEAPASGDIYNGAIVQVANGGAEGVNMRISPGGDIVTTVIDGTQLNTTGDPQDAEGYTWWPVSGEAGDGWIAQDFLTLVQ